MLADVGVAVPVGANACALVDVLAVATVTVLPMVMFETLGLASPSAGVERLAHAWHACRFCCPCPAPLELMRLIGKVVSGDGGGGGERGGVNNGKGGIIVGY